MVEYDWEAIRTEIEGKEFYCYPLQERRTVTRLVTVNGYPILGRAYNIVDDHGDEWEIQSVMPPEANGGMLFSVLDPSQKKWAERQADMIAEYAAEQAMRPVARPKLRDPADTAIVYQFWRYHVRGEIEMESLEAALSQAEYDVDYNEASPGWVTQGDKVLHEF